MQPDIEEHLIGQLLGCRLVAHDPPDEAEDLGLVPQEQRLEGRLVGPGDALHQSLVFDPLAHDGADAPA